MEKDEALKYSSAIFLLEKTLIKIDTHVELVTLGEEIEQFLRPTNEQR